MSNAICTVFEAFEIDEFVSFVGILKRSLFVSDLNKQIAVCQ